MRTQISKIIQVSVIALFTSFLVAACGKERQCDTTTPVTYADAQAVFETYCTHCHSTTLNSSSSRQGAPTSVNFNTYDEARSDAEEANEEILDGDMPKDNPGAVSDAEGCIIEAWIKQGYPQ